MYSLRRAACRLSTTPSPIFRSRLKAIPRARLHRPPQRTFTQSKWPSEEGKNPLDSKYTNATPTPTSTSTLTPTETSTSPATAAETSTETIESETRITTDYARDQSVVIKDGVQTESVEKEVLKGDLEDGLEANTTENIATGTVTESSSVTTDSEDRIEVENETAETREKVPQASDSFDTPRITTSNEALTNPSIALGVESETQSTQEYADQESDSDDFDLSQLREAVKPESETTQENEGHESDSDDFDYSSLIGEAAAEEEKVVEQARARDAAIFRSQRMDMLRQARYIPNETVFIGNLFYDVTADDLKAQMMRFGVVEAVNIIYDSRGISKGYGYVQFDSQDAAQRAIDHTHMQIFEGRRVTMYFAQARVAKTVKRSLPTNTLYIGNMSFEMTDRDINELVKDLPGLIDVRVTVDRDSGQLRGYFHAEFVDVASAEISLEKLSIRRPYGRKLRVDFSNNIHSAQTAFRPRAN